jgi:ABC-type multidrug transport system ATPase subunit
MRVVSSYVEQEDALLGALTVKETLTFAAKLSLPS